MYSLRFRFLTIGLSIVVFAACGDSGTPGGTILDDIGSRTDVSTDAVTSADVGGADDDSGGDIGGGADTGETDVGQADTIESGDAEIDADATIDEGSFGWPCEAPEDCDSGYCVRTEAGGDRVCTVPCLDECEEPGWECAPIENLEGDRVFLCLPAIDSVCRACEIDEDCGSLSAACTSLDDGAFCLPRCVTDEDCDAGFTCERAPTAEGDADVCLPAENVCSGCLDPDGDGYGIGVECDLDCAPTDADISPGATELCDGLDNDCDGIIDEDFDLASDPDHCGACGTSCDVTAATALCVDSVCEILRCDEGFADCDGDAANGCERPADTLNACGGCTALDAIPGEVCGACDSGEWVCDGTDALDCAGDDSDAENACGGCEPLAGTPDTVCGTCDTGTWTCDGEGAVACVGEDPASENVCGGCDPLDAEPASSCGTCGSGEWVCEGEDDVRCVGDEGAGALNACGGCDPLDALPGAACGTCDSGRTICDGEGGTVCDDDAGVDALNACGGCAELEATPGTACGDCGGGVWTCFEADGLTCVGDYADSDDDGVCDPDDVCPGFDDRVDTDGDGVPNACDDCPLDDPDDSDSDGACDTDDACPGFDDRDDVDGDGTPDGCDTETCDGVDNDGDAAIDEGCDVAAWSFYGLPFDYFGWDANAAALLGRAATYGVTPGAGIAVVSDCVDTTDSTSASNPGAPYLGEYNSTIGALEFAGIAPARIVRVATATEAASTAGSWDVIIFPEMERCVPSVASWRPVLEAAQAAGKRVISTYGSANNDNFFNDLDLFGTGTTSSVTTPYRFTATDPGFAAGLTVAGYQNATSGWSWTADRLEVLMEDASGRQMVIRVTGADAPVARHNVYLLPYDYFAWDADAAWLLARAATYEGIASPRVAVVSECADTTSSTSSGAPGGPYSGEFNATIAALQNGGIPAANIVEVASASEALATRATWDVIVFPEMERCEVPAATWSSTMSTLIDEGKRVIVTFPNSRSANFLNGLTGFGSGTTSSYSTPFAYTDAAFSSGRAMSQYHSATATWSWTGTDLEVLAEDATGRSLVVRFRAD